MLLTVGRAHRAQIYKQRNTHVPAVFERVMRYSPGLDGCSGRRRVCEHPSNRHGRAVTESAVGGTLEVHAQKRRAAILKSSNFLL